MQRKKGTVIKYAGKQTTGISAKTNLEHFVD